MFFVLSKIVGYILQPTALIVLATAIGTALLWTRFSRTARTLLLLASLAALLVAFSPLNFLLLGSLEYRIAKPDLPDKVDGIVILGGAFDNFISTDRNSTELFSSADRITEAVALANRFPKAKLVISGGSGALIGSTQSEAQISRRFFEAMGISADRVIFEDRSRNTYENAILTKSLINPDENETWLLITSAFHMPRSMGIFRKVGWVDIIPWPVDFRTRGWKDYARVSSATRKHFEHTDLAVREYIGLVAYWLTGRTDALFPANS